MIEGHYDALLKWETSKFSAWRAVAAMAMAMAHVAEQPELPSNRSELPIPLSLERVVMASLRSGLSGRI